MSLRWASILLASCGIFSACGVSVQEMPPAADCRTISIGNIGDCVRLNQIQTLGTHNSYHVAPPPSLLSMLGEAARDIEYSHRPLTEQLALLGIRKLELDVFADPDGGHFRSPAGRRLVEGLDPIDPALSKPGFKVLHTPDVDYRTTCLTLVACLTEIRNWSRRHRWHVPIMVMIEAKDSPLKDPKGIGYVRPVPIGAVELRALDAEIRTVFHADHVMTPDRVRGQRATLADAIRQDGWPTLREARGKVLFALDNTDQHRADYLRDNPSLEGRMLFVSSEVGEPSAAFIKMNEVMGAGEERIRGRVREGYLIRTRADLPTGDARTGSTTRRDAAFRSGAHYVSTDYPQPSPFGSGYIARLPGAERLAVRCNPVNAPAGCRDEWLEPAPRRTVSAR
jgi:hypothetical protein